MSWKNACYIHAGLSNTGPISIKGPDAERYLQSLVINSFAKFPVGTMKHGVACTPDGLIASHGIIERKAKDEFETFATPLGMAMGDVPYDVEITMRRDYLFQVAGPASLAVLEKITGETCANSLPCVPGMRVNGIETEIGRIGMSGNLAYSAATCPLAEGPAIYDAVFEAGKEFGIERLGDGDLPRQPRRGRFPADDVDVCPGACWCWIAPPWQRSRRPTKSPARSIRPTCARVISHARGGSMAEHGEIRPRVRRAAGPCGGYFAHLWRTTVTLRWNADDVADIFASLLRKGPAYKPLDFPYAPNEWPQAHADHVLKDGRRVGVSSGTILSYYFREVLSMGCVDVEHADLGTEVIVQWGDHGGPIKDVRATVERFPYLTDGRNSDVKLAQQKG